MTELPPPAPPPPPVPSGAATDGQRASGAADGWDWDRARALAEDWFRPLGRPEGWWSLAYLFVGMLVATVLFAAVVAVGAVTFALMFVVVGFLLVVPFFLMVEQFAKVERTLASLAGHEIELRVPARPHGIGPSALRQVVTDPIRWRQVAFVNANVLLAPLIFAVGGFPASFVAQVVFGDTLFEGLVLSVGPSLVDVGAFGILTLPVAAFLLGAVPRVAIWAADLKAQLGAWFLGTSRLAAAQQRVSTLSTQRQDILDAVASERRRIERNLHDGVQQQLVAIGLDLGMAEQQLDRDPGRARELLGSAREKVQGSIGELRQLGRGLHPAILADRGIDAALSAVVSGAPIPISVHVDPDLELSTDVAETVYFVANEAVANVLKHAKARVASVHVAKVAANVRVTVHDDGVGGVDPARGTGIAGIRARVNAVDGTLTVSSPEGGPTTIIVEIPRHHGQPDGSPGHPAHRHPPPGGAR